MRGSPGPGGGARSWRSPAPPTEGAEPLPGWAPLVPGPHVTRGPASRPLRNASSAGAGRESRVRPASLQLRSARARRPATFSPERPRRRRRPWHPERAPAGGRRRRSPLPAQAVQPLRDRRPAEPRPSPGQPRAPAALCPARRARMWSTRCGA